MLCISDEGTTQNGIIIRVNWKAGFDAVLLFTSAKTLVGLVYFLHDYGVDQEHR